MGLLSSISCGKLPGRLTFWTIARPRRRLGRFLSSPGKKLDNTLENTLSLTTLWYGFGMNPHIFKHKTEKCQLFMNRQQSKHFTPGPSRGCSIDGIGSFALSGTRYTSLMERLLLATTPKRPLLLK